MCFRVKYIAALGMLAVIFASAHGVASQPAAPPEAQACLVLKKRMGVHDKVPPSELDKTWFCDVATWNDPTWWIIGLHSFRQCDGICSSLRGWFAVNRRTGEVREWDVGEWTVGGPVD
jgi:hypothetical protein